MSKQLIPYINATMRETQRFRLLANALFSKAATYREDFDTLDIKYRQHSADLCSLVQKICQQMSEFDEAKKEPPKISKKDMKSVKVYYKRLSNLTHPDKTKGLDAAVSQRLHDLFMLGKEAYNNRDLHSLSHFLEEAVKIRTFGLQRTDKQQEVLHDDVWHLESAQQMYRRAANDVKDMEESIMYQVQLADKEGDVEKAVKIHRYLLMQNIQLLNQQLEHLRNVRRR